MTDNDKTKTVTKNVVSLSSADERKVKASKYTLAIGSSFGHGKYHILFNPLPHNVAFWHTKDI